MQPEEHPVPVVCALSVIMAPLPVLDCPVVPFGGRLLLPGCGLAVSDAGLMFILQPEVMDTLPPLPPVVSPWAEIVKYPLVPLLPT